ncbi:class I fructose-bisphosphate aldolase [Dyadobacter sp. 3J3]|uniref:class I fructose-bisphosphate aldolase n=1 Tax=Dyadobacter sp. 3J3 TaxID=2606600 RepID=UPI001E420E29|nr:class I fructose-bisphosphate aldolase [Dyadobacter sp. 3J3]
MTLKETVSLLLTPGKGLLAMDESIATCNRRFAVLNIPQTVEYRRKYRELIVTTPCLENSISGAILADETITQSTPDGEFFTEILYQKGIIPGIKVDQGAIDMIGFPDEKITEGLDGINERLEDYYEKGARFAKWRAVITIGQNLPTKTCIASNAFILSRYAAACQKAGIVPIVEPEVLMDGNHSMQKCEQITIETLHTLFDKLYEHNVDFSNLILKPNMVLPGLNAPIQDSLEAVAEATINCLLQTVPATVPGISFLSGGQSPDLASQRLNLMHIKSGNKIPWKLTFSFSRAIQQPALEAWNGMDENLKTAQDLLVYYAAQNSRAVCGKY